MLTRILWGATYASGIFEIFSSRNKGTQVRDLDLTHIVVLYFPAIQQTVISSHAVLNLIDPVSFLKCYSFMANLALGYRTILGEPRVILCDQDLEVYASDAMACAYHHRYRPRYRSAVDVGMHFLSRPKP